MSTVKVNTIEPAVIGSETYFLSKAWINFNGTGTPAARSSGNVSSITDDGTGRYTLTLTSPIVDVNYATVASASKDSTEPGIAGETDGGITKSTTAVQIGVINDGGALIDATYISVVIVR